MRKIIFLFLFAVIFINSNAYSQDFPSGKFWGTAFGDYFYKAGGDSSGTSLEYTKYKKDFNSFEFRRINVGFDYSLNENFTSTISLSFDGDDVTTDGKRTVNVRDAFIKWKNIFTNSDLSFGILPTPGFNVFSDKAWGYRSIEKTILDQRGFLSSRDLGIMLNGSFDKEKKFGYYFMIGNGRGARLENNKYKRFYGNLTYNTVSKNILFNIYADYEPTAPSESRLTLESFLGLQFGKINFGIEAFEQYQKNQLSTVTPWGISSFINGTVTENKLKYFFRYDYYDSDNDRKQHFVSAGLDFTPDKRFHIMPNIWLNMYGGISNRKSDVVPRITLFFDSR